MPAELNIENRNASNYDAFVFMCQLRDSVHLMVKKIITFRRFPPADRKLAFAAIVLLTAVSVALRIMSLQRVTRLIKISNIARPIHNAVLPRQVAWAVQLASRYMPRATCLPQAVTTQLLLSWHGHSSRLHIGVALAQKFEAHAWVECEGSVVIGGTERLDQFTPILTVNSRQS